MRWFTLLWLVCPLVAAQTTADDLLRAHDAAWSTLVAARNKAAASVEQQPWESEAEWKLRQTVAAAEGTPSELKAWSEADTALQKEVFWTDADKVTVKLAPGKAGRTLVSVASQDPALPYSGKVEVAATPAALKGVEARLGYQLYGLRPGRYRVVLRSLQLKTPTSTVKAPLLAGWDFDLGSRQRPQKAAWIDTVKVEPGATIWLQKWEYPATSLTIAKTVLFQRTPMTQALYQQLAGTNPSAFAGQGEAWQRPVEMVNRVEARWICNLLSQLDGLEPVYQFKPGVTLETIGEFDTVSTDEKKNGWRLPNHDEFFYAAAGGKLTKRFTFVGGDDPDQVAWWTANSGQTTHPVGQKLPNELGLYDMAGNVMEWTERGDDYPLGGSTSWNESHGPGSDATPKMFPGADSFAHDSVRENGIGFRVVRNGEGK